MIPEAESHVDAETMQELCLLFFKGDFADSENTDPRRSHPGVFYIDINSIPLSFVETFSINQRLRGMI
jgi:hypothetical protein